MVARATSEIDAFSADWLRAENVEISRGHALGLYLSVLATGGEGKETVSARSESRAEKLLEFFEHSPGAHGRTLADWVQGVTY